MPKDIDHIIMAAKSQPGIQRDGTVFDSQQYIDGQWVRFYRGNPRKIGGYKQITVGDQEIIRQIYGYQQQLNTLDLYLGRTSSLFVQNITSLGVEGLLTNRTPVGYIPDINNLWQFEVITAVAGTVPDTPFATYVIAVAPQNLSDINNQTPAQIYYGDVNTTAALQPLADDTTAAFQETSGGIVATGPFLFQYGNDGVVSWCSSTDLLAWESSNANDANTASITGTKIVKGLRTRGGGVQSVLFWSLDSLIRATYSGNTQNAPPPDNITNPIFSFDTIDDDITILSSNCVVREKNMFFWIGIDQFYWYNGVVQPIPNSTNANFFFDNLNYEQRQKVWGVVNPRWKEVWWFAPLGVGATECNHAIIFNYENNFWFDTVINRAAGINQKISPYLIFSDNIADQDQDDNYPLWLHEIGTDQIKNNQTIAIPSSFETNLITLAASNPVLDRQFRTRRIEPDFVQNGSMNVSINNRGFANGDVVTAGPYSFNASTEKIDTSCMGRQVSFLFESNISGGFYEAGKILVNFDVGDVRPDSRSS